MRIIGEPFTIHKKNPLTISRGTTGENTNIWVRVIEEDVEGWGEASPFDVTGEEKDSNKLISELESIVPRLQPYHPLQRQEIETILLKDKISPAVRAAIDTALHDWLGKKVNLPLWKIWGLNPGLTPFVSGTIGIGSPEYAIKRASDWLEIGSFRVLKVKLGSKQGISADKAVIEALKARFPDRILTVDANGGWDFEDAVTMCGWLGEKGIEYIEQPLPVGEEKYLKELSARSPLPIFIDESCFDSRDIIELAAAVGGINIKLMKAGGLTEAKRMIDLARTLGLKIMFGCYSDSSLANSALCQLAPLVDYLDLDSHLNLVDDPFTGVSLEGGRLILNDRAGLGVARKL